MSKNLTRKGLALGAAVALGASLLGAAPAQAATGLNLVSAAGGENFNVPHGSTFVLKAFTEGIDTSLISSIAYKITTAGGFEVAADADDQANPAGGAVEVEDTVTTDVVTATDASAGEQNWLELAVTANAAAAFDYDAASKSVTVVAFLDGNGDGSPTGDTYVSSPVTVTWVDGDNITWSTNLKAPTIGDTTVTAYVTATPINGAQTTNAVTVDFAETTAGLDPTQAGVSATWDADNSRWSATSTAATLPESAASANVVAGTYTAQAKVDTVARGSLYSTVVSAATIDSLTAVTTAVTTSNTATASNAVSIKTGASSVVASTTATLSSVAVKGATVTFTIAESAVASLGAGTVAAGGKTLSNTNAGTSQTVDVTATTDADGKASITLTLTGLVKDNAFTVVANAQGRTGTLATYTVADSVATSVANTNAIGESANALIVAKDASFTMNYVVLDQYGAKMASSASSIVAVHVTDDNFSTIRATATSSGAAVSVVVPAYATTGSRTIKGKVYVNGSATSVIDTQTVLVGTAGVAAAVTVPTTNLGTDTGSGAALQNKKAFTAADTRQGETAPTYTSSSNLTVAGQVTDANGNGIATTVTLSGTSLDFIADGVYARNTITLNTEADGSYSVDVLSNKSGKHVLTAKSGAVSKTADVYIAVAGDEDGTALTISVPSIVKSGNALVVRGSLVDAFGNPVTADGTGEDLNVTYSGPGFAGTIPTSVDADGTFRFYVLLGSNDTGAAKITVGYDLDEDADYSDTGDILVSKTVLVGVSASVSAGSKKANVVVKNATGLTVKVVSGSKSTTKVATSDSYKLSLTKLTSGSKTVKVYVEGILVTSKKVTVRR